MKGGDGLALSVDGDGATLLPVRAQPGARRRGVLGMHDGALRLGVRAAPERGRANAELEALLAELLGLRAAAVGLVRGAKARRKVFRIELPPDEVRRRLDVPPPGPGKPGSARR